MIVDLIQGLTDLVICFQERSSTHTNGVLSGQTDERPYDFLILYFMEFCFLLAFVGLVWNS